MQNSQQQGKTKTSGNERERIVTLFLGPRETDTFAVGCVSIASVLTTQEKR